MKTMHAGMMDRDFSVVDYSPVIFSQYAVYTKVIHEIFVLCDKVRDLIFLSLFHDFSVLR
jgi:hypothetical protein